MKIKKVKAAHELFDWCEISATIFECDSNEIISIIENLLTDIDNRNSDRYISITYSDSSKYFRSFHSETGIYKANDIKFVCVSDNLGDDDNAEGKFYVFGHYSFSGLYGIMEED